jgi:hypothetical protein
VCVCVCVWWRREVEDEEDDDDDEYEERGVEVEEGGRECSTSWPTKTSMTRTTQANRVFLCPRLSLPQRTPAVRMAVKRTAAVHMVVQRTAAVRMAVVCTAVVGMAVHRTAAVRMAVVCTAVVGMAVHRTAVVCTLSLVRWGR